MLMNVQVIRVKMEGLVLNHWITFPVHARQDTQAFNVKTVSVIKILHRVTHVRFKAEYLCSNRLLLNTRLSPAHYSHTSAE